MSQTVCKGYLLGFCLLASQKVVVCMSCKGPYGAELRRGQLGGFRGTVMGPDNISRSGEEVYHHHHRDLTSAGSILILKNRDWIPFG